MTHGHTQGLSLLATTKLQKDTFSTKTWTNKIGLFSTLSRNFPCFISKSKTYTAFILFFYYFCYYTMQPYFSQTNKHTKIKQKRDTDIAVHRKPLNIRVVKANLIKLSLLGGLFPVHDFSSNLFYKESLLF